jgi:hypothetical protein
MSPYTPSTPSTRLDNFDLTVTDCQLISLSLHLLASVADQTSLKDDCLRIKDALDASLIELLRDKAQRVSAAHTPLRAPSASPIEPAAAAPATPSLPGSAAPPMRPDPLPIYVRCRTSPPSANRQRGTVRPDVVDGVIIARCGLARRRAAMASVYRQPTRILVLY